MEIGRTDGRMRRKISQNGAREKIAPSWGICGGEKKQTKIEESECTFLFHCARKSNRVSSGNLEVAATEISLHEKQARAARRPSCRARDYLLRQSLHPDSNNIIPHHHRRGRLLHISAAFSAHGGRGERDAEGYGTSDERRNYKNH